MGTLDPQKLIYLKINHMNIFHKKIPQITVYTYTYICMDTRLITSSKYALSVTSFNKPFNHVPKNEYHTINLPLTLTLQPTIHKPKNHLMFCENPWPLQKVPYLEKS